MVCPNYFSFSTNRAKIVDSGPNVGSVDADNMFYHRTKAMESRSTYQKTRINKIRSLKREKFILEFGEVKRKARCNLLRCGNHQGQPTKFLVNESTFPLQSNSM